LESGPSNPSIGWDKKKIASIVIIIVIGLSLILAAIYYIPGVRIVSEQAVTGPIGIQVELKNDNPFRSITVTVVAKIIFYTGEEFTNSSSIKLGPSERTSEVIFVETTLDPLFYSFTWDAYIQ
jgi:hypothetical protein